MPRVYNFSPGPAVLPLPVLEEAQRDLVALPGVGMSVLEISHRSKTFEGILAEAQALLTELLAIPAGYRILLLQGGASLQFAMIALNLLRGSGKSADYIVSGSWGNKALAEARREGSTRVVWDGKADKYSRVPSAGEFQVDPAAAYVYYTSNETIEGVQYPTEPAVGGSLLVCDASSDFLSRPVDVARHGAIMACAQKNAGIAGVTVVIVREDLLERAPKDLSPMLSYRVQAEHNSLYNTPPTFAVYVLLLVCRWLKQEVGGLAAMHRANRDKAQKLYDLLDAHPDFYRGHARPDSRSLMNVTFRLPSEEMEQAFVKGAQVRGLFELKGHRSVGGIRASIYNAMPAAGVEALRDYMLEFRHNAG